MKKVKVELTIDAEKYHAVQLFMEEKNLKIETELSDFAAKLYKKHVPAEVRKYIDGCSVSTHSSLPEPPDSSPVKATESGSNEPDSVTNLEVSSSN